jgi:3-oxoacyl-[acyl-carrier-protein] synthase II
VHGTDKESHRIVVTGMGVASAAGCTVDDLWDLIVAGKSVASAIERVELTGCPIRFGCEVRGFEAVSVLSAKEARRLDRTTQLTVTVADLAWADAGAPSPDLARVATVVGTGFGGLETAQESARDFLSTATPDTKGRVSPLFIPTAMPNAGSAQIAIRGGYRGACLTVTTACAAGANAIGEGARLLQQGAADVVVTAGAEAPITAWIMSGFAAARALSERRDDPGGASRPFDADRDGFVIAEGAASLVLERLVDARARGAHIHAELLGYGRNTDAHHLVAPPADGSGARDCMQLALDDAGITAADVTHVNAHGTSTEQNDVAEAAALRSVFGGDPPPVTSAKGAIGHAIGAAGALEAVASILTLTHGTIPPTANYATPDPAIDLDVVTAPRELAPGAILSNSFAFGGHNATLVFARL